MSTDRFARLSKQLDDFIAASPNPDLTAKSVDRACERVGEQYESDVLVLCQVLRGRGLEPVS